MKIKGTNVRVSIINLLVVGFLTIFLVVYAVFTGEYSFFVWGLLLVLLMLLIPLGLNYMSGTQYAGLEPVYEAEAKNVRIRTITPSSIGNVVRIEGIVERVLFKFLNRPQYVVADKTGDLSVKMFISPGENIEVGDYVEVYGQVIKRYMVVGDPVVNAVIIRKTERK